MCQWPETMHIKLYNLSSNLEMNGFFPGSFDRTVLAIAKVEWGCDITEILFLASALFTFTHL